MHLPKSRRHADAARARWARWRAAEARAEAERAAGIADLPPDTDCRDPIVLDLRSYGGKRLRIEPRAGYVACRVFDDETGELVQCCALKTALHEIAASLPRTLGIRAAAH